MTSARVNLLLLVLLLIAAFTLRAWDAERMSVEHFDEGVYASNLFSDHLEFRYPNRELYAPPLLPAIFEWVLILTGANPHAVMWVNVVLGTALVAAVWWTTIELSRRSGEETDRQSVSREVEAAGLAAAALIAFSDLFIQYSRAALTDVPVCLWMTLAVGAGARAFRTGSWGWVVMSSVFTALAWWTKYNGWLPLAILGAGLAGWLLFTKEGRASLFASHVKPSNRKKKPVERASRPGMKMILQWGIILIGAVLMWSPYLWSLQSHGGYAAVAANHKGYLVGFSGWWDSVVRHLAVDRHYFSWASGGGWLAAASLSQLFSSKPWPTTSGRLDLAPSPTIGIGLLGIPLLVAIITHSQILTLMVTSFFIFLSWKVKPEIGTRGHWILLAWILGLTLATPLYRPYPRLILPWLVAMNMAAGIGIAQISRLLRPPAKVDGEAPSISETRLQRARRAWVANAIFTIAIWVVAVITILVRTPPVFLQDRRDLKNAAVEILDDIQADLRGRSRSSLEQLDCIIYVLAEPGLYYHLAAQEDQRLKYITQPASNLGMLEPGETDSRVPAFIVTGLHSHEEAAELSKKSKQVRSVAVEEIRPSDLVLLDDMPPSELKAHRVEKLELWRIIFE